MAELARGQGSDASCGGIAASKGAAAIQAHLLVSHQRVVGSHIERPPGREPVGAWLIPMAPPQDDTATGAQFLVAQT